MIKECTNPARGGLHLGINPECRSRKHENCDGRAACQDCGEIAECDCECHHLDLSM